MICPECHAEYIEGIEVCADCKVSLVDSEPLKQPLKEIKWVALDSIDGKVYAEMVSEVFTDKNIPHYIKSDWISSAFSIDSANLIGSTVKIFVPEANKAEAEIIFKEILG